MITVEVVYEPVERSNEPWLVVNNNQRSGRHKLKQSAEKDARKQAKNSRPSQLVIRRKDGDVSYMQRYDLS